MNTYTYNELGFGPILLDGGISRVETEWGPGTSYERIDDLHRAIALAIARSAFAVDGKVLRFLRQTLGLTQKQFGAMEGYQDGQMVGQWEKGTREIPESVITNLRLAVRRHLDPQTSLISAMDDIECPLGTLMFTFRNGSWQASHSRLGGWTRIQETVCAAPLSVGIANSTTDYHDTPEPLAA